jgi:tetratricopeptide (TPR) repeat protein
MNTLRFAGFLPRWTQTGTQTGTKTGSGAVFSSRLVSFCILHSAFCIYFAGCASSTPPAPPPQPPAALIAANSALGANQPDTAIADAQSYLKSQPYGPQAAQAWYFEGRGYEMKIAADPNESQRNLFEAHSCYLEALQQGPVPSVEGDIRASLSNVAFFQDDFAEAIRQATTALGLVTSEQTKSFLLFRIGVSQQRLGEFTDADLTFHQVEQKYPNTPLAQAARDHQGQRDFYVQLATFASKDQADKALDSLRSNGVIISERTDSKGNTIIDNGPFTTYADAKKVKDSLSKSFPQALIVP